jgi:hypothetical protein
VILGPSVFTSSIQQHIDLVTYVTSRRHKDYGYVAYNG